MCTGTHSNARTEIRVLSCHNMNTVGIKGCRGSVPEPAENCPRSPRNEKRAAKSKAMRARPQRETKLVGMRGIKAEMLWSSPYEQSHTAHLTVSVNDNNQGPNALALHTGPSMWSLSVPFH